MLENPNNTINLRRRNSSPASRHAALRTNKILAAKSNPYVGWFRHSPPTSHRSMLVSKMASSDNKQAVPRWSRHDEILKTYSFKEILPYWLHSLATRDANGHLINLGELLCPHLPGGAPLHGGPCWNKDHPNVLSSVTQTLLTRVASWLLDSFHEDDFIYYQKPPVEIKTAAVAAAAAQDGLVSEDESSCSSEDSTSTSSSSSSSMSSLHQVQQAQQRQRRRSSSVSSSSSSHMMISSQAEAHYAHSLLASAIGMAEHSAALADQGQLFGRLDYEITQMDVVRMTRNASRHLDVDSIVKLPTLTYQTPPKRKKQQARTAATAIIKPIPEEREQGWSWMLVNRAEVGDFKEVTPGVDATDTPGPDATTHSTREEDEDEEDVCVICLEHFVQGDRLRVLPCNHSFHVGCIDQWLSGSHSFEECYTSGCPTCKKRPTTTATTTTVDHLSASSMDVPSWAFARIGHALHRRDSHK